MVRFLYSLLRSIITPTDVTILCNGSSITFTKEGDLLITASRHSIHRGKYIFHNCSDEEIHAISSTLPSSSTTVEVKELC